MHLATLQWLEISKVVYVKGICWYVMVDFFISNKNFARVFYMLESYQKRKSHLRLYCFMRICQHLKDYLKKGFLHLAKIGLDYGDCPSFVDWEIASHVCDCLKVFYNATLTLCGIKYVISNLYFSDICIQIYGENTYIHIEKACSFFYELYVEYAMSMNIQGYALSSKLDATSTSFETKSNDTVHELKENFKKFLSQRISMSSQKTKLDVYLEESHSSNEVGFDIAKDIFAISVTSVVSESTFSTGSRVIDDNHSSLLPETMQVLIFTQDWLPSQKN
ncbi:hypothetical protein Taro_053638, partial [Colocasia esculenta]|nr:hypothetical protein [Colocasia esculenta]